MSVDKCCQLNRLRCDDTYPSFLLRQKGSATQAKKLDIAYRIFCFREAAAFVWRFCRCHHQQHRKGDLMMTNQNPTPKIPSYIVYTVKPIDGSDKPAWIKVGAGWVHNDGEGLNLILNILGQDVNLTIRPNKPKSE